MATKSGLMDIANELILSIADCADSEADISRLSRINKRLHSVLSKYLLQHNIRYNRSKALQWAAERNDIYLAKRLIKCGADLESIVDNSTPLHMASIQGHLEMVQILLDAGADPDSWLSGEKYLGICSESPIGLAIKHKHVGVCHLLISRSKNIHSLLRYSSSQSPATTLNKAAERVMPTVVRDLLERGAVVNPEGTEWSQLYPLQSALQKLNSNIDPDEVLQCVLLLLEYGADIDLTGGQGGLFWPSSRSLGQEHQDPRIRALFSKQMLPMVSRGCVPDEDMGWAALLTLEEAHLLARPIQNMIFDLSRFRIDREKQMLYLDAPFPVLKSMLQRCNNSQEKNIEEEMGYLQM